MERLNIGINPGKLRHTITLLEPTTVSDASGVKTTYAAGTPPVTGKGEVDYIRGAEVIKAGQDVTQVYITVLMRWDARFTPKKRIQADSGNQYIIQSIENVKGREVYMVLNCTGIGVVND